MLISVALPVYNGENFISKAINSILSQGHQDFELIVSDNCSTDQTLNIVKGFAEIDPRIKVVQTPENQTIGDNFNFAANHCAGEWIQFFCHDDIMLPDCLSGLSQMIKNLDEDSPVALISHKPAWLFQNGTVHSPSDGDAQLMTCEDFLNYRKNESILNQMRSKHITSNFFVKNLLSRSQVALPALTTAAVRKDIFEISGGFDNKYIHFDVFKWIKLLTNYDLLELDQSLTLTRIHGNQVFVDGRKSMRSLMDHQNFWKNFVAENLRSLSISQKVNLFTIPTRIATGALVCHYLGHDKMSTFNFFKHLPPRLWPVILAYFPVRFRAEKKRICILREHVPLKQIYP